jgi:hypothetical protein
MLILHRSSGASGGHPEPANAANEVGVCADLVAAYGGVDADVQSADLRAAERQFEVLSELGRWAA